MSVGNMIDDYDNSNAISHLLAAKGALRRCIDHVADARVCNGRRLEGRDLDHHLEQLIEIEGDLSRAEGELIP